MSVKNIVGLTFYYNARIRKYHTKLRKLYAFYWSSHRPYPSLFMLSQGSATGILHVFLSCVVNICHYKIENFRHELHRTTGQSARAGVLYVLLCYLMQT